MVISPLPMTRGRLVCLRPNLPEMELLPCLARPTFVLVQRTNLAAKESTGKPTISIKAHIWMSSYPRNLDPVPTEVAVPLITKFTRIYGKKLGSPISTLKGKC